MPGSCGCGILVDIVEAVSQIDLVADLLCARANPALDPPVPMGYDDEMLR
jgi:hypothetical protein